MLKPQSPGPQSVTLFGDGVFEEVIKLKGGHYSGALVQHDWCPYKKKSQQGCLRGQVRTQAEDVLPKAKDRGRSRNQLCQPLIWTSASRTVGKHMSVV